MATFRRDAAYSDGRHPDAVSFSTAREDARRRDFTVNGLFFDPLTNEVIDYVGGRADLAARVVRAIGNPVERFAEDKLRLLRAVRFASTFDFQLDAETAAAVRQEAASITIVSAERIAAELRKILVPASRARGVALLRELGLLAAVLPESRALFPHDLDSADTPRDRRRRWWPTTLRVLDALHEPTFRVALAALLWGIHAQDPEPPRQVAGIGDRWRLSNHEADGTVWLLTHEPLLRRASTLPWPVLQRILIAEMIDELLLLAEAIAREVDGHVRDIDYCRGEAANAAGSPQSADADLRRRSPRRRVSGGSPFPRRADADPRCATRIADCQPRGSPGTRPHLARARTVTVGRPPGFPSDGPHCAAESLHHFEPGVAMDKKAKKKLDVIHQHLQILRQQLAGARKQNDTPGEVERLEAEIARLESEAKTWKDA